jgi:hypothetical protein
MKEVADIKQISGEVYIQFVPTESSVVKMCCCRKGSGVGEIMCCKYNNS